MDIVGLNPNQLYRYPHAFSGGQGRELQLLELSKDAKIIICDEAVSALDVPGSNNQSAKGFTRKI